MAIDDNPLTVFNKQLENDELAKPAGAGAITQAVKVTGVISQIPPLRPLGLIAKGLDLVGKCLTLGVPTVEENLKLFGKLTEDELLRVEEKLDLLQTSAEQFQRRVESKEFSQYLASGVLQTQRTTQENRLRRMAWIIANGVKENDLEPESGDDMMRAAVELTDFDILLLNDMYRFAMRPKYAVGSQSKDQIQQDLWGIWQDYWHKFPDTHPGRLRGSAVGGFGRLAALGLIYGIEATSMAISPVSMNYWITDEGIKFHRRIQESSKIA